MNGGGAIETRTPKLMLPRWTGKCGAWTGIQERISSGRLDSYAFKFPEQDVTPAHLQ
jgi:hypothetical protein